MKIIPFDRIHKPKHKDYLGWMGHNPNIEVLDSGAALADFIWYCACGDGPDLEEDLHRTQDCGKPVISITLGDADYSHCLSLENQRLHFSTMSPDWDRCVPYLYDDRQCQEIVGGGFVAVFIGSFKTNPARACMKPLAANDVVIEESDWWANPEQHAALRKRHLKLMSASSFTLCPRGIGRSSMRLVEAMLCNSIPIMIDDQTRLFGQELGEFCLWSGMKTEDIAHAIEVARTMETSEYWRRCHTMVRFLDDFLRVDHNAGCTGTIGYSEYIRRYVQAKP